MGNMVKCVLGLAVTALLSGGCIEAERQASGDASDTTAADTIVTDTRVIVGCPSYECEIGSSCVRDQTPNPEDPCEACLPAVSTQGWSPLRVDAACDDGDPCTPTSRCAADGECVGTRDPQCIEDLPCVESHTCSQAGCEVALKSGFCLIEGACVAEGAMRLEGEHGLLVGNPCVVCSTADNELGWTVRDRGGCDDGDRCTVDDKCRGPICQGTVKACDDEVLCTLDFCERGICQHEIQSDACFVDGVCYEVDDRRPGGPCEGCAVGAPTSWTILDGEACEPDDACLGTGSCSQTRCVADRLHLDAEPNDSQGTAASLGAVADPAVFPSATSSGNLNPGTDIDWFTYNAPLMVSGQSASPRVVLSAPSSEGALSLCVWAVCGTTDETMSPPAAATCGALTVTTEGNYAGCCAAGANGQNTIELQLDVHCAVTAQNVAGTVAVRVQHVDRTTTIPCTSYDLAWGVVP